MSQFFIYPVEYDYVKEFGEGVDRVFDDMAEAGLPEPEYRQSEFMLYATLKNRNWGKDDASWVDATHDTTQDTTHDRDKLIEYCFVPRSRQEMMEFMGLANRKHFSVHYLKRKRKLTLLTKP